VGAFLLSFGVIFVAELGDKSQLMALAFATRYRPSQVLLGITLATAIVHAGSVVAGAAFAAALPTRAIGVAGGIAFLGFAAWTIRGDRLTEEERERARRPARSAIVTVGTAFGLAELGDKTMIATITLAAGEEPVGTWLGSTVGMVAADALAIVLGRALGTRLPERAVSRFAATSFIVFGVLLMADAVRGG